MASLPQSGRALNAGILAIALAALLLGAVGTRYGAGLTPDTILYLDAADAIRAQGEFPTCLLGGSTTSVVIPPLYPYALALVGAGLENPEPSRWLNVILYGLNVAGFGMLLRRLTAQDPFFTLTGTGLAAFSLVLLEIHTASWSEPLFLAILLGWIWALAEHLETGTFSSALLAGALVGLSPICRFAGVTSVAAALVTLMLVTPRRWKTNLLCGLMMLSPVACLLLGNKLVSGVAAGAAGGLEFHWPGPDLVVLCNTVAAWLAPGIDRFHVLPAQDALAWTLVLIWLGLVVRLAGQEKGLARDSLFRILAVHTLVYPAVILALVSTIKADLPLEQRIMMPMHVTILLLTVALLARSRRRWARPLMLFWLTVYVIPALVGLRVLATSGRGYLGPAYRAPEIQQYLKDHPPDVVHTNDSAALWLFQRRVGAGLGGQIRGPVLFFRVNHPLPPRHKAAIKRPRVVPRDDLERAIRDTPLHLELQQAGVELYLPDHPDNAGD
jgi:hypothetical protein